MKRLLKSSIESLTKKIINFGDWNLNKIIKIKDNVLLTISQGEMIGHKCNLIKLASFFLEFIFVFSCVVR